MIARYKAWIVLMVLMPSWLVITAIKQALWLIMRPILSARIKANVFLNKFVTIRNKYGNI